MTTHGDVPIRIATRPPKPNTQRNFDNPPTSRSEGGHLLDITGTSISRYRMSPSHDPLDNHDDPTPCQDSELEEEEGETHRTARGDVPDSSTTQPQLTTRTHDIRDVCMTNRQAGPMALSSEHRCLWPMPADSNRVRSATLRIASTSLSCTTTSLTLRAQRSGYPST